MIRGPQYMSEYALQNSDVPRGLGYHSCLGVIRLLLAQNLRMQHNEGQTVCLECVQAKLSCFLVVCQGIPRSQACAIRKTDVQRATGMATRT